MKFPWFGRSEIQIQRELIYYHDKMCDMLFEELKEGEKKMKEVIIDGVKYVPEKKEPPTTSQLMEASSFITDSIGNVFKFGDFKLYYRSGNYYLLTKDKHKELFE